MRESTRILSPFDPSWEDELSARKEQDISRASLFAVDNGQVAEHHGAEGNKKHWPEMTEEYPRDSQFDTKCTFVKNVVKI